MTTENLANIVWLGKYANYQGMPVVPLESLGAELRQSMEKTFHTTFRITERKPTASQTLKIVGEFTELGGDYPPKHNLATLESYFPTAEDYPHQVGDTFRVEATRKYVKCDMDANRENVLGMKDGQYDNHFVHKVNWKSWQYIEGKPHSTIGNFEPKATEEVAEKVAEKVVEEKPQEPLFPYSKPASFKDKAIITSDSTQTPSNPQVVKVTDERQADRDARQSNNSDQIAGQMITELWKAGRFPQMLNYTDIVHIGEQVKVLSKVIQGHDTDTVQKNYNEFLQKVMGIEDWLEHGFSKGNKK